MGIRDPELTTDLLLKAYANGYFPMAMSRTDEEVEWFYPEKRGIIPLGTFHVPHSLVKAMRKKPFTITTNRAFPDVIAACAECNDTRKDTWINRAIIELYTQLWEEGYAHSVECWEASTDASGSELVGGLYGVAIGGAFFGESMFSRKTNASRIALVHLVELLKNAGYQLLDTQFVNEHLQQFGVIEIPRAEYLGLLQKAIRIPVEKVF